MSTPTVVQIAGLTATATRAGDNPQVNVHQGATKLGTLTFMDTFGYDAEFAPTSQAAWETYAPLYRATCHLARQLRGIATTPAKLTTKDTLLVLPDVTVADLAGIEDVTTRALHVPATEDAHAAVTDLITTLKAAASAKQQKKSEAPKGESAVETAQSYDPYGVLSGLPSTLTYPAKVDGTLRLVTVSV